MMIPNHIRDYYQHSPYFGSWPNETPDVYTAKVGSMSAGEIMQLQIKVEKEKIIDARVKVYGSGYAIAVAAFVANWSVGRTRLEFLTLTAADIAKALQLPDTQNHSAVLGEDLLRALYASD